MSQAQLELSNAEDAAANDQWADSWEEFLRARTRSERENGAKCRVLDLFSGVGGLALGFTRAAEESGRRVESVGAIDTDALATRVYATNLGTLHARAQPVASLVDFQVRGEGECARFLYPPELVGRDVDNFRGRIDVVLAGPPCQGHSSLNNSTRGDDPRNRLYLSVPAIAAAVDASVVVIENVPGVVRSRENVVDTAIRLLEANDYRVTAGTLAADGLGWPQTRKRYFVIGRRDGDPLPLEVVSARHRRNPLPVSWAIEDLLDRELDAADPMDGVAEMSDENVNRISWLFENDAYDTPNHLRPDCHQDGTTYGAVYGRMWWDRPAPTLTTGFLTAGRGRFVHAKRPRTLTPREAARIQGFPDWFDFCPPGIEPRKRDLAKWIGNAVPTVLGHAAGLSAVGE